MIQRILKGNFGLRTLSHTEGFKSALRPQQSSRRNTNGAPPRRGSTGVTVNRTPAWQIAVTKLQRQHTAGISGGQRIRCTDVYYTIVRQSSGFLFFKRFSQRSFNANTLNVSVITTLAVISYEKKKEKSNLPLKWSQPILKRRDKWVHNSY